MWFSNVFILIELLPVTMYLFRLKQMSCSSSIWPNILKFKNGDYFGRIKCMSTTNLGTFKQNYMQMLLTVYTTSRERQIITAAQLAGQTRLFVCDWDLFVCSVGSLPPQFKNVNGWPFCYSPSWNCYTYWCWHEMFQTLK